MLLFFPVFQLSHGIEFNVTKDGKLCLYANLELTFSVTYEDLDNQVGVFVLAMWITILKSTAVHINTVLTCDSSLALIRHFSCDSVFVPVMWRGNEGFPEKTHFLLFSILVGVFLVDILLLQCCLVRCCLSNLLKLIFVSFKPYNLICLSKCYFLNTVFIS